MQRPRKYLGWALVLLLLVSVVFGRMVAGKGDSREELTLVKAVRGTLEIQVVAMGTLVSLQSVVIASEIQSNRAKVVRLMSEGTVVKPGDLLVEFDATPFVEDVTKYSRALKEAEANLLQARQDAQLQKAKAEQLSHDAVQRLQTATLELKILREGGGPLSQKEAKARVEQNEQQLLQSSRNYADAEAFLKGGFITRQEYEQALSRLSESRRSHDLAVAAYEMLMRYRQPADEERSRMNLKRAQDESQRLQGTAFYEGRRQEALQIKAETALDAAKADLKKAQDELGKTRIVTPAAGFLVYNELPFGSDYRKIQVGDSVWQGQAFMTIPDTSQMAVETFIREFDLHKVQAGQQVKVTLEAFPDLVLHGKVDFIGSLVTKRGTEVGSKYFSLRVRLNETHQNLRPGMTARVEIGVEKIPNALLLPIEAVFERDGHHYCYVVENGEVKTSAIQIGRANSDSVVIEAGLDDEQLVSLAP